MRGLRLFLLGACLAAALPVRADYAYALWRSGAT